MPSTPIRYLAALDIMAINAVILQQDGGVSVVRDQGLLEGAVMRAQMATYYEDADLVTQTVLLIAGIAQSHPFVDGNKRAALVSGIAFLRLNGCIIESFPEAFGRQIEALVKRELTLDEFTAWLRERLRPITSS